MSNTKGMAKEIIESSDFEIRKEIFSDQPRFSIMFLLYLNRTVAFTELQHLLKLTPGNLDHHIKKLEKANYVIMRKKFSWRPLNVIMITNTGVEAFRSYASYLKKMLKKID